MYKKTFLLLIGATLSNAALGSPETDNTPTTHASPETQNSPSNEEIYLFHFKNCYFNVRNKNLEIEKEAIKLKKSKYIHYFVQAVRSENEYIEQDKEERSKFFKEYYEEKYDHQMKHLDLFIEIENSKKIEKTKQEPKQTPLQSPKQTILPENNSIFRNYTGYDTAISFVFCTLLAGGAGIYIGQNLRR